RGRDLRRTGKGGVSAAHRRASGGARGLRGVQRSRASERRASRAGGDYVASSRRDRPPRANPPGLVERRSGARRRHAADPGRHRTDREAPRTARHAPDGEHSHRLLLLLCARGPARLADVTQVAKAVAVLVVTVTRSESGESEDTLEQRIEVAQAVVREVGGEAERMGRDAIVGGFPAITSAVTAALASIAGAGALGAVGAIVVIALRRRTPVPGERRLTVAVLQYKVSAVAPDDAWLRDAVRDGLNTQLSEVAGVKVYSREFLDFIISHEKASEMEVATRLGIDKMLTGSVTVMGGTIRVDTQIVDVATGMIESGFTRIGRRADFLTVESEVILGAIEKFDVRLTEEEKERLAARRESDVDVLRRLLAIEGGTPVPPAGAPSERVPAPDPGSWLGPRAAWADDEAVVQAAIMAFLERYRAATEAGDVTALATMYADFSAEQRAALQSYFGTVSDLRVSLEKVDV